MLKYFQTYGPLFVFLLLASYSLSILHTPISKFYHEIAYTAKVQNVHFTFHESAVHSHSQEMAQVALEIAKAEQEKQQGQEQQNIQKPKKDLKILNTLPCDKGSYHLTTIANFKHPTILPDAFQQLVLPPPRA